MQLLRLSISFAAICVVAQFSLAQDWKMRGGSPSRNNTPEGKNIADDWELGPYNRILREHDFMRNIKWHARLGSQSYGNPIIADGRVFVGSNNGAGHLKRFPSDKDLGTMLCFRETDGKFLWQHSNLKLATGRVHDWPLQGVCSTPLVEGNRMWYVSNRGEVVCLDTEGFYDDEDDGPVKAERVTLFEADALLEMTLKRRKIAPRLRAQFEKAGVTLDKTVVVRFDWKTRRPWKLLRYDKTQPRETRYVPIYEIDRKDDHLVAFKLDKDGKRTMQLFAIDNDQFPGLAMGDVDEGLRAIFAERGFELPMVVKMKVVEHEKQWTFTAKVNDVERTFDLSLDNGTLTCISTIHPIDRGEADVVWRLDMMKELGTNQHNMANCSPASFGDLLFINTSTGVDESHARLPAPDAPSFIALDKTTGKLLWQDASPGKNILHGQWSSPAVGVFEDTPQVIFPGGDGWVYSFRADRWDENTGKPILLWKFDANPKTSKWILGGRGTRNNIVAMPVIYDGRVYITMGQDPEHGEGNGHIWCIDPTKRGDVSPELAVSFKEKMRVPLEHRRIQAVNEKDGERAEPNPNSAVIWHYGATDHNKDGKIDFEEQFHRSISTVAIKNDLLFAPDFSGLVHCLDAKTGKVHWVFDTFAHVWGSPLIVDGKVYIGDEDGDINVLALSADPTKSFKGKPDKTHTYFYDEARIEHMMHTSVYTTPMVANNVLYISNRQHLFAIEENDGAP